MRSHVYTMVRKLAEVMRPRSVVEYGSYIVEGQDHLSPRTLFECSYIGYDMRSGPGVDVVTDMSVDKPSNKGDLVLCLDTLEHVCDIEPAVDTLVNSYERALFVVVPFAFSIHDYPSDYWRLTPNGLSAILARHGATGITVGAVGDKLSPHTVWAMVTSDTGMMEALRWR